MRPIGTLMKSFALKIFILIFAISNSYPVFAQAAYSCNNAPKEALNAQEEYRSKCNALKLQAKSIVDGKSEYVAGSVPRSQIIEGAKGLDSTAKVSSEVAGHALNGCTEAYNAFIDKMNGIAKKLSQQKQQHEAQKQSELAKNCENKKEQLNQVMKEVTAENKVTRTELLGQIDESVRAQFESQNVIKSVDGDSGLDDGSFTWKDAGKWGAIGGAALAAGAGALSLLGGSKSSGSGNSVNSGSSSGTGTGSSSSSTVDCNTLSSAVTSSSCDTQSAETCLNVSKITTSDCQTLTSRYCGTSGAGLGTSYCRAALSYSFCSADSNRSQCASCVQVTKWNSPGCETLSASGCVEQFSSTQLTALASLVVVVSGVNTTPCATDPIYTETISDANPLLSAPILPSSIDGSSLGSNRTPAATSSSVGSQYSSSLLNANTTSLLEMCKQNQLVNCI